MPAGPAFTVKPVNFVEYVALPLASALILGISPAWLCVLPGCPCALPSGLKWPAALIASGAEQSPFSWTWNPCSEFGLRPLTLAFTKTSLPCHTKLTSPLVFDPERDSKLALAFCPVPPPDGWQAVNNPTIEMPKIVTTCFMFFSLFRPRLSRLSFYTI